MKSEQDSTVANGVVYVPAARLAAKLSVSQQTIRNWANDGVIPSKAILKIGSVYRFDEDAVIDALKQREGNANG